MLSEDKISDFLSREKIDAALIQKDENCRYISGFTGSESYLLLTGADNYLITDARYTEQAKKEADRFIVINYKGDLAGTLSNLVQKHHVKNLGVESQLTYKMYLLFHEAMPDVRFQFCSPDVLREVKSQEELDLLQKACEISDAGFEKTVPFIKKGISEARLRAILESAMLEAGSEGKSFDTIVASGWRSEFPHGTATDKLIDDGDLITFDFGAIYHGYHSDITRTVAVGHLTDKQKFIYDKVLACNMHIESYMKAGMKACDADHEARMFLKQFDLDSYFTHALGHSVGLEIHEAPVLAPRDHTVLKENMTETVEPGVYVPNVGGVRIEDTVVIKQNGLQVLTKYPKKLLILQ
jgi:Xaa-Pro aminopeptidase